MPSSSNLGFRCPPIHNTLCRSRSRDADNPSFAPSKKASKQAEQAAKRPLHLTYEALSKLCNDAIGAAILAEARAESLKFRYEKRKRPAHHFHMSSVLGKATLLRRQAEANHSQLHKRHMERLGSCERWFEQMDALE